MVNRILVGGFAAALAGAAMLAISSAPASAFTLTSPSLEQPVAAADIQHVWCHWNCGVGVTATVGVGARTLVGARAGARAGAGTIVAAGSTAGAGWVCWW